MNERCKSVLKDYRERAGFKQEEAAQRLNISSHTLYNYETAHVTRRNMPPDEIVLKMTELYINDDDPVRERMKRDYMKIQHLSESNLVFGSMFLNVMPRDLPTAFLMHQIEHEDVKRLEEPMRRVIIDNKIDETEADFAGLFAKEVMECAVSSMNLVFSALERTVVAPAKNHEKVPIENKKIINKVRVVNYESKRLCIGR